MSNFLSRLILTLVSIPLLIFFIFWPQDNHIVIIIFFGLLVTFYGSYEIASLITKKKIKLNLFFIPVVNLIIFIFSYLYANNILNIQNFKQSWILFILFIFTVFAIAYAGDIFKKDLKLSFDKMAYIIFGIIYMGLPSFFIPLLFNIDFNPAHPVPGFFNIESHGTLTGSLIVLFMILTIFANDIFCYVFGISFGRKNVIGLEASPKKSWAGYIGGFFSTFVIVYIYYLLFENVFHLIKLPLWFYITFSILVGILVPVGDLVESVIKRSVQVKDSGALIMGRGGVLDSADSILYFVPLYFIILQFYFSL